MVQESEDRREGRVSYLSGMEEIQLTLPTPGQGESETVFEQLSIRVKTNSGQPRFAGQAARLRLR